MITFRLAKHLASERFDTVKDRELVEIVLDGVVVAAIYSRDDAVRLVSAHIKDHKYDSGEGSVLPIPCHEFTFDPQPYRIEGGKLVRFNSPRVVK
jgi:hypothetical protein